MLIHQRYHDRFIEASMGAVFRSRAPLPPTLSLSLTVSLCVCVHACTCVCYYLETSQFRVNQTLFSPCSGIVQKLYLSRPCILSILYQLLVQYNASLYTQVTESLIVYNMVSWQTSYQILLKFPHNKMTFPTGKIVLHSTVTWL